VCGLYSQASRPELYRVGIWRIQHECLGISIICGCELKGLDIGAVADFGLGVGTDESARVNELFPFLVLLGSTEKLQWRLETIKGEVNSTEGCDELDAVDELFDVGRILLDDSLVNFDVVLDVKLEFLNVGHFSKIRGLVNGVVVLLEMSTKVFDLGVWVNANRREFFQIHRWE